MHRKTPPESPFGTSLGISPAILLGIYSEISLDSDYDYTSAF